MPHVDAMQAWPEPMCGFPHNWGGPVGWFQKEAKIRSSLFKSSLLFGSTECWRLESRCHLGFILGSLACVSKCFPVKLPTSLPFLRQICLSSEICGWMCHPQRQEAAVPVAAYLWESRAKKKRCHEILWLHGNPDTHHPPRRDPPAPGPPPVRVYWH